MKPGSFVTMLLAHVSLMTTSDFRRTAGLPSTIFVKFMQTQHGNKVLPLPQPEHEATGFSMKVETLAACGEIQSLDLVGQR